MPPSYPGQALNPQQTPLSKLLLSHAPNAFRTATQHPFLRHAGLGTVSKATLSTWLSQDRIYAQAYVNFIGALIARVHLPHSHVPDKANSLRWRILKLLSGCLSNIQNELDFFDQTAARYGLQLDRGARDGVPFEPFVTTKQYEGLFRAFGSDTSMSLLEGLVVLWGTEMCYLKAWKYARSLWPEERSTNPDRAAPMPGVLEQPEYTLSLEPPTPTSATSSHYSEASSRQGPSTPTDERAIYDAPELVIEKRRDLDGGALREAFIPNWTSKEFEGFVEEIGEIMDELCMREEGWRRLDVFKAVWEHILEIEKGFWPNV